MIEIKHSILHQTDITFSLLSSV